MAIGTKPTRDEVLKNLEDAKRLLAEAKANYTEAKSNYAAARIAAHARQKRKKETLRKTSEMPDVKLVGHSRTWHTLYEKNLAAFTAFDATLITPNNWKTKIDALEAYPTDEFTRDEVEEKTQPMQKKIAELLEIADAVEHFVKRAFPNDARKLEEFGFEKLRRQVPNYVGYLSLNALTIVMLIPDYLGELTAAGMPAGTGTALEDAVTALALAETEQEYVKRLRIRRTTQRIKMFNELWDIHLAIKSAAKIIYRDKEEMVRQFE